MCWERGRASVRGHGGALGGGAGGAAGTQRRCVRRRRVVRGRGAASSQGRPCECGALLVFGACEGGGPVGPSCRQQSPGGQWSKAPGRCVGRRVRSWKKVCEDVLHLDVPGQDEPGLQLCVTVFVAWENCCLSRLGGREREILRLPSVRSTTRFCLLCSCCCVGLREASVSQGGPVCVPALCSDVEWSQSDCNENAAGGIYCGEWLNPQP